MSDTVVRLNRTDMASNRIGRTEAIAIGPYRIYRYLYYLYFVVLYVIRNVWQMVDQIGRGTN